MEKGAKMSTECKGCEGIERPWKCDDGEIDCSLSGRLDEETAYKEAMEWKEMN